LQKSKCVIVDFLRVFDGMKFANKYEHKNGIKFARYEKDFYIKNLHKSLVSSLVKTQK